MEGHFSFASFTGLDFWLPVQFFVAGVAEAFGVMFFFLRAVATFFYHHVEKRRSYIKYFVQTEHFRSLSHGRTSYNVYCANLW